MRCRIAVVVVVSLTALTAGLFLAATFTPSAMTGPPLVDTGPGAHLVSLTRPAPGHRCASCHGSDWCTHCGGTGAAAGPHTTCPACQGTGSCQDCIDDEQPLQPLPKPYLVHH